jgi:hypothetical protein
MNVLRRIVLGPCPCQGCREAVTWNGYAWEDVAGNRHFCDNARVGISDVNPDIMCDALLVADTSREGVSRLEVSAP